MGVALKNSPSRKLLPMEKGRKENGSRGRQSGVHSLLSPNSKLQNTRERLLLRGYSVFPPRSSFSGIRLTTNLIFEEIDSVSFVAMPVESFDNRHSLGWLPFVGFWTKGSCLGLLGEDAIVSRPLSQKSLPLPLFPVPCRHVGM